MSRAPLPPGVISFTDHMTSAELLAFALRVETWGYDSLWVPELYGREPLATCGYLLAHTTRLKIATGVAVLYARDALTAAQGRRTLGELGEGRFMMGLGVSHPDLIAPRGLVWVPPVELATRYLQAMEKADLMSPAPARPVPTFLAGHGPKLLRVAAEHADGSHMYLVTPERARLGREILGETKQLRVCLLSCLCDDPAAALAALRRTLAFYIQLPAYHRQWAQSGFEPGDWSDGGSDRLVDHLFAWGSREQIEARMVDYYAAGADQVILAPIPPREGASPPDEALLEAMAPAR